MNSLLNNRQTTLASWVLTAFRWCAVGGYIYFLSLSADHFDYKSAIGDFEKAESLSQIAGMFFWVWASLILVAILLSLVSPKLERSMVLLLQALVLPSLEFGFMLFIGLGF